MLASAFALTNCSEEFVQQIETPETDQAVGVVPFEIYASALQTKTANDGMSTVWVENDQINVFHAEAGAASYVNDGVFAIYKQNLADGLFQGALKQPLTASAYDWYFFYPYTIGMKTPAGDAVVTLAGKTQTQKGNSNMAHIAGVNYPMCAVVENVAAGETPAGMMQHMTALVAINVQNNTSKPMTVVSAGIRASESLVGTYYMDFTGEEVVYTPSGDQYVSNTANLEVVDGEDIAAGSSAKFYIAVKPFTAEAGSRLTVYVNGSQKTITIPETTEFEAGKIKTINVPGVKMKNSLKTSEDVQAKHFEAGDNTDPFHSATINGVKANNVVVIGTENETGKIVLKGSISDFVNMNELGFFAASWTGKQGALAIDQVAVQFPAGMIATLLGESMVMTAEEIAAKIAEQSGQEVDLDKLMFKPVTAGTFKDGETNHTLTILDEELHYYGITEDEINSMVASTGLTVDDLRAIINGEESLEDTLVPILESLGVDTSSVMEILPIIEQLMPEIREAQISVTLKTVTEDQKGNTYDPRVVIWGMNLYFN